MAIETPRRVAIIGRPNVGKSTLFNRLLGRRRAITLDTPGVTRDPLAEPVVWDDTPLVLIDTGGLRGEKEIALADKVHAHTVAALATADIAVVIFDVRTGISPTDRETVDLVLRSGVHPIWVANKADSPTSEEGAVDFCQLGIDPPLTISAEHNHGIGDLKADILRAIDGLPAVEPAHMREFEQLNTRACRVALVGRPNVGKSSFLNRLAGAELSLVDDTPGTTRDVVDTTVVHGAKRYLFVDTAGLRRPSKVERGIEKISVHRTFDALDLANVVVLMIEPVEGMTDQDARIARRAWGEGRALIVVVNKMDLKEAGSVERVKRQISETYPTLSGLEVVALSVLTGRGVDDCFKAIDVAHRAHEIQIQTPDVNRVLAWAMERKEPPVLGRGRLKLLYGTQTAVRPPTITIFSNREAVPTHYVRFLERCFRESFPLAGTPLRLRFNRRDSHGSRDE
jgi:GTP-binding protein